MTIVGTTHVDNGTVVNLAYGNSWSGSLVLSALVNAVAGGSTRIHYPSVTITGDQLIPDGTVIAECPVGSPAVNLLSLLGNVVTATVEIPGLKFNPGPNGLKLTLHLNGADAASATAAGG